jgi:para-nitrobenzyl esterase
MSVNCLVASPLARGLFQRAIAQSGATFSRNQMSLEASEKAGAEAAKGLNADSLAELRAKSSTEIMTLRARGGPIVDGYVLPEQVADIFAAGEQNPVDLLTGWNEDEGLMFGPVRKATEFKEQIQRQYGERAGKLLEFYPATDDAVAAQSQLNLSRDTIFGTQNYLWANAQAGTKGKRVFVYRFTRKVPGTGEYAKYGAFHTGEVPYAFDNLKFADRPWEAVDHELTKTMSRYWVNFIRTGDPNGNGQPRWPDYDLAERKVMFLGMQATAGPLPDRAALEFMVAR